MFYGNISCFSSGIFHFEKVTSSFFANFNRFLTWGKALGQRYY